MNLQSLLIRIEAWATEELAAQRRLLAIVTEQEAAIAAGDTPALEASSRDLQGELGGNALRDRRRRELMASLATGFGVAPVSITLSSIAERARGLGFDADRLVRIREELRDTAAAVLKRGRRVATLARYHRGLVDEILTTVVNDASLSDQPLKQPSGGALVDAEA